ncbi:hypothetical protein A2973_04235 [Candidatus Gottesmanbacteria bacterium RIFCSPLOWO2_01_FULL_49_10]|uniref:Uncharacterized protein n=1 Tax=Candidatus Gottesmanbacteria bacterium RIFCSPLOWO2_01_FULL_49_10 TaxID=1798396 RepID=A0A1F6AWC5_9BACT|nr:MAG: hypothetical protein A2973_04235 [Candidatus Gottesmanbacteria bacterium RIFCSPLOWO2_01_FULL_49_10]
MGNERQQAHLGIWFGDSDVIHTWQPPLPEDAHDPQKGLDAVVAKVSGYEVIPFEASVRISRNGNVVIGGATIGDKSPEAVLRLGDAANVLFDGTNQPISIKVIAIN